MPSVDDPLGIMVGRAPKSVHGRTTEGEKREEKGGRKENGAAESQERGMSELGSRMLE